MKIKWYKFEENMPIVGQNIIVADKHKIHIGLIKFNEEIRKSLEDSTYGHRNPCFVDFYTTDVNNMQDDYFQNGVEDCVYWMFPNALMELI